MAVEILNSRRCRRANCRMHAIAFDDETTLEVTITNMSATGCRIEGLNIHLLTGHVTLDVITRGIVLNGNIAWQKGRQMGIRFMFQKKVEDDWREAG